MNGQLAAAQRLLTFADGENTSLHSSPGPVEISRYWLRFCPSSRLEQLSEGLDELRRVGLLVGRMLQELRVRTDRSGSRFFTGRRGKSSCLLGTRLHRDAEDAEGGFCLFVCLFVRLFLLNVVFSRGREAAATNDELNTAAAAVGAQI